MYQVDIHVQFFDNPRIAVITFTVPEIPNFEIRTTCPATFKDSEIDLMVGVFENYRNLIQDSLEQIGGDGIHEQAKLN